jgi:hypothetical protein
VRAQNLQARLVLGLGSEGNGRAAKLLVDLAAEFGWPNGTPPPELLAWIRNRTDPVASIAGIVEECESTPMAVSLLAAALEARPRHPGLLACLALTDHDSRWQLAFFEQSLAAAESAAPAVRSALTARILTSLVELGAADRIVDLVEKLPPGEAQGVLGAHDRTPLEIDGIQVALPAADLHLDYAAARLRSDRHSIRTLAGMENWPSAGESEAESPFSPSSEPPASAALRRQLLARLAESPDSDPFDFFVEWLLRLRGGDDESRPLFGCLWADLFGGYSRAEGYPSAAQAAGWFCASWIRGPESAPYLQDARAQLTPMLAATLDERLAQFAWPDEGTKPEETDGSGASVRGRDPIAQNRPWPREFPLAEAPPPPVRVWFPCTPRSDKDASADTLPTGFSQVRCEERGDERVVLALSQRFDPVGEVSFGGYWVLRSSDGGARWRALYTGLRESRPYVATADSTLPMVRPEGLLLQAEDREIDESSIFFPPVDLHYKRVRADIALELPWSALERDSDGDNLTDLAEQALLTDENSADTDGDGFGDALDPLPGVAYSLTRSPVSKILQAILREVDPNLPLSTDDNEVAPKDSICRALDLASLVVPSRTQFVIGDAKDWAGVCPSRRVVVMTPAAHELLEKQRGSFYPMSLETFFLDRARRRAFVVVSESWRGTTSYFELRDGVWRESVLMSIIT